MKFNYTDPSNNKALILIDINNYDQDYSCPTLTIQCRYAKDTYSISFFILDNEIQWTPMKGYFSQFKIKTGPLKKYCNKLVKNLIFA